MTERGRSRVARDASSFTIGPSSVRWDGTRLTIDIDERAAPPAHLPAQLLRQAR